MRFGPDVFDIDIKEIKPQNQLNCICVINCNVEVDFMPALDDIFDDDGKLVQSDSKYQQKTKKNIKKKAVKKWNGDGVRIDGRAIR